MNKSLLVVLLICVFGALALDLNKALSFVPEDEWVDFLKYHAMRGYHLDTSGTVPDYQENFSDEFSIEVYRALLAKSTNAIVENSLSCIVCWPNGRCVDLCDPGVHPV